MKDTVLRKNDMFFGENASSHSQNSTNSVNNNVKVSGLTLREHLTVFFVLFLNCSLLANCG